MREHMGLFRGKRIDNGKWVEGDLVRSYINMGNACITDFAKGIVWGVDPDTVGECTGLKDKNGKLIFEGDILKWDEREWGYPYSEVAEWKYPLLDARKNDWKEWCEIIGNIHDNPELLKGGEG